MSNVRKTLQMTSLLFGMCILFCYIAWSLGYEGFIIAGYLEVPFWSLYFIRFILLCTDLSLRTGFILNMFSWNVLKYSIPLTLASEIGTQVFGIPAILLTGPIPTLVFIIAIFMRKHLNDGFSPIFINLWIFKFFIKRRYKLNFVRLLFNTLILLLYQWITYTFSGLEVTVYQSVYQALRLSINVMFINLLFFSIGGVKYYGRRLEFLVHAELLGNSDKSSESFPKSVDGVPVTKFEKWMMRSVIAIAQPIQWMFILWVCNLDNLFLDALVMTTSFICHGMIIKKRNHFKPVILCTLISTGIFYFTARFTPSFTYSQFLIIVMGLLQVYALYYISYQFELITKKKSEENLKRIEALEKQMIQAWSALDDLS